MKTRNSTRSLRNYKKNSSSSNSTASYKKLNLSRLIPISETTKPSAKSTNSSSNMNTQVRSNSYKSTSKLSNRFKNLSSRLNSKQCYYRNWSMITDSCSSSGTSHARTWCRCSTSIVTSLSSSKAGLTKHLSRSIRSIWSRLSNFNSNSLRR